ncbi:MAG: magnesium chelatase subunit H [Chromatocurvus sp.]
MKPKPITAAETTPLSFVLVTLDNHVTSSVERAAVNLSEQLPGVTVKTHAAAAWASEPETLQRCIDDIATGDIVVVTMMFLEEHINAVLPALTERQPDCDAMICCMSAAEVMKLTRMGKFTMEGEAKGPVALLKRLRGKTGKAKSSAGAQQLTVLRQLPKILRFVPGTAQDVRAYFLTLQYWLAGSELNIQRMMAFLIDRYAAGDRSALQGSVKTASPFEYPDTGLYDPDLKKRITEKLSDLPRPKGKARGTVGLLIMRSYALAGNTQHYDAMIAGLRSRNFNVITAFASGLDARPAVEKYFIADGKPVIDAVVSLTGFSLVGGPAYNDSRAAEDMLATLDVPYIAAHALEFQSLEQWEKSDHGLMPIEATMMVAIPELDGATGPSIFGGRSDKAEENNRHDMRAHPERIATLVNRVDKLVALRKTSHAERKVALVIFNFPPHAGNTGTAANLSVFQSLFNTMQAMQAQGYSIDLPADVDALRSAIIEGNAAQYGAMTNIMATVSADDHVAREPYLEEIESQWGPAPGKELTDGRSIFIMGAQFGNVMVGVQPGFGYEGDPMRLLFERGFAPTHAFSAFYRYLREDFGANSVLHFGTHGALEFMPGKQAGMSGSCWPDRLISDLPNFYLYASNNPSEGLIAKRRSAATLISYMTPPITQSDLYQGMLEVKASIDRWRSQQDRGSVARDDLASLIQLQASELDLCPAEPVWNEHSGDEIEALRRELLEVEQTLIPHGLHVVGKLPEREEKLDLIKSIAHASHDLTLSDLACEGFIDGVDPEKLMAGIDAGERSDEELLAMCQQLSHTATLLDNDGELDAILHALDGGFIRPAPGGDLLRTPDVLPTGRNVHGFDPFRLPSQFAMRDARRQTNNLLDRHAAEGNGLPESIALVLWGSDNLKNEGGPIGQALALLGAEPRVDGYGRISGANLIPLEDLGRPRIDVVITLSGIFRDLLPLQTRMLAEAAYLAAAADEPEEMNFVRKHALAHQAEHGVDLETAALRVFSNAEGAYGSNVNLLIDNSRWEDEGELADTYTQRKCYAYSRSGQAAPQAALLNDMLSTVQLAYQNLDSVEVGITTVDHYFDTLGGISRAVKRSRGEDVPVYISDQTTSNGKVRTLSEQVALETRTRVLNPKWYESVLEHGFEGVRQIESHVTNTMGWSATTGQVAPWVYQKMSETFILDETMRKRLAKLNPAASVKVANRLLEAHDRKYWNPDEATLDALRKAGEDLEDWLEGVTEEEVAA